MRRACTLTAISLFAASGAAVGQNTAFSNFGEGFSYNTELPAAAVMGTWAHSIQFDSRASGGVSDIYLALTFESGGWDYLVRLQTDANGEPGAVLDEWPVEAVVNGRPPAHIRADGTVEIVEGGTYWLTVVPLSGSNGHWREAPFEDPGTRGWSTDLGATWRLFSVPRRWAFRIDVDDVAECYADCNGDEQLTLDDFLCFMDEFAAQSPYADCNGDGQFTLDDFLCFMDEFATGCP